MTLADLITRITSADHDAAEWLALRREYEALLPTLTPEEMQLLENAPALMDTLLARFEDNSETT